MNQQHEAIRWLHQEKGFRPSEIAKKMNIETSVVHSVLRKQGITHERQPKTGPVAPPLVVNREPCARCNVRADLHELHGCRRFT